MIKKILQNSPKFTKFQENKPLQEKNDVALTYSYQEFEREIEDSINDSESKVSNNWQRDFRHHRSFKSSTLYPPPEDNDPTILLNSDKINKKNENYDQDRHLMDSAFELVNTHRNEPIRYGNNNTENVRWEVNTNENTKKHNVNEKYDDHHPGASAEKGNLTSRAVTPIAASTSSGVGRRPSLQYFYKQSLNINDVPSSTKEFQAYAKLSKLSDIRLKQELTLYELDGYDFRSPHEAKMAIVSKMMPVRSRTPISDEWRKKQQITESQMNVQSQSVKSTYLGNSNKTRDLSPHFVSKLKRYNERDVNNSNNNKGGIEENPATEGVGDSSMNTGLIEPQININDNIDNNNDRYNPFALNPYPNSNSNSLLTNRNGYKVSPNITKKSPFIRSKSLDSNPRLRSSGANEYYFRQKIIEDIPTGTKETKEFGKLSKLSAAALDKELQLCSLENYKYRNSHEKIMAIISVKFGNNNDCVKSKDLFPREEHQFPDRNIYHNPFEEIDANQNMYEAKDPSNAAINGGFSFEVDKSTRFETSYGTGNRYFYRNQLTEDHPSSTRQSKDYGMLSKLSSLALDRELESHHISSYKFRSTHEKIMAVIACKYGKNKSTNYCDNCFSYIYLLFTYLFKFIYLMS
jgi:hypothetical protein